jgi:drug/metabolite transporter (DMT)-like permease
MDFKNFLSIFGGEAAALGAAFFWASASVLFARMGRTIRPMEMNLLKNTIASALLVLTLWVSGALFAPIDTRTLVLLVLSGFAGLGFGDTVYFQSLKHIGPRRALLLMLLAPPGVALMALFALDEHLSSAAWVGIFVTVAGVAWVMTERAPAGTVEDRRELLKGVAFGLLAALGQATGAVLTRAALMESDESALRSALIRLLAGAFVVTLWMPLVKESAGRWLRGPGARRTAALLIATVFVGTYMGMWLQQISLKLTAAGIAQTLFMTSPLFVLPLAAWSGDRVSPRAVFGAAVALGGVALLFTG